MTIKTLTLYSATFLGLLVSAPVQATKIPPGAVLLPPGHIITSEKAAKLLADGWQQIEHGLLYKDLNGDGDINRRTEIRAIKVQ